MVIGSDWCAERNCWPARWKLRTLMRTAEYFTGRQLVMVYKVHLLSYLAYRTSAVYHASKTTLAELDKVQQEAKEAEYFLFRSSTTYTTR